MVFDLALIDFLMGCEKNIKKHCFTFLGYHATTHLYCHTFFKFYPSVHAWTTAAADRTNCAMRCSKYYGNCCSYTSCAVYICIVCNTCSYISSTT